MNSFKKMISGKRWFAIVVAILALGAVSSVLSPVFLDVDNFRGIILTTSVTGIMAVGLTFVIMTSGIDISIGGILFMTAGIFVTIFRDTQNFALALGLAIGASALAGFLYGFLVYKFKMAPMITTLATYSIYRGYALHVTEALNIAVPREYTFLGNGKIGSVPIPMIILFLVMIIGLYMFKKTRFGTYVMALGNSSESAEESHLPVKWTLIAAYFGAGITSGIAGIILVSRLGGLQGGLGIGLEFTVIAAVVLGGTKLTGGSGTIVGSVLGAIFLVIIDNVLTLVGASPYVFDSVRGAILLFAVIVDRVSAVRQSTLLKEQKAKYIRQAAQ